MLKLRDLKKLPLDLSLQAMNRWPLYDAFERGMVTEAEFINGLNDELSLSLTPDTLIPIWNTVLGNEVAGIENILQKLSTQYPLFILTNSNPIHITFFKTNYPWVKYFTKIFTSFELGYRKPEAPIYQALIKATQLAPEELLFLDDRIENVEGARRCGITSELCSAPERDLPVILKNYAVGI